LFFWDFRVVAANLLRGKEGLGFCQLMEQPPREQLIIASLCAIVAERRGARGVPLRQVPGSVRPEVNQVSAQQI